MSYGLQFSRSGEFDKKKNKIIKKKRHAAVTGRGRRYFDFKNHFLLEWQFKENKIQCELWIFRFYCQALIFSPRHKRNQLFFKLITVPSSKLKKLYNMTDPLQKTKRNKKFIFAKRLHSFRKSWFRLFFALEIRAWQ